MNPKRHPGWLVASLAALDAAAAAVGSIAAFCLRFHAIDDLIPPAGPYSAADYWRLLPAASAAWAVALYASGLYSGSKRVLDWRTVGRVFQAALGATGLLLAYIFFARPESAADPAARAEYSRVLSVCWLACTFGAVTLARWAADRLVHHMRRRHQWAMARVLVVGSGEIARQVVKMLKRYPEYGRHVVGVVQPGDAKSNPWGPRTPVLGDLSELSRLVREHRIDEVIVTQPDLRRDRLHQLMAECERDMVDFMIVPDLAEMIFTDINVEEIDGIPFLGVRETPLRGWRALAKRLFDIAVSAILLAILLIPGLIVAWLVRRHSPGPAFYRQRRIGADGREYTLIKFRSMRADAEDETGPIMAAENDPRVTPLGRILRRKRIDEWPQLINVLKGEMSLVGPRPERPFFVHQFKEVIPRYMARHKVKSGITGLAQVNGLCGPHGSIEQRVQFDLRYIENWSFGMDLMILARTALLMLRKSPPTPPITEAAESHERALCQRMADPDAPAAQTDAGQP